MRKINPKFKAVVVALFPAIFLALVTFLVFFTTLVIKHRTFYVFPDNIDQFYAWYQKLSYSIHGGTLPIWDANVSSGHSFVGELQAGVFYPINLLWVWMFGTAHGISIFWLELIVVFHFWLGSLGMYYAGRSLGIKKVGALAAGLAFVFGGVALRSVSQTAIFFGICYIPWAFFWFQSWLNNRRKLNLLWCGVALGFIILAGHIDPLYFACLIIVFLILFRRLNPTFEYRIKTYAKDFVALGVALAVSLVVALPQILLSAQYLPRAVRFVGEAQPILPGQPVSLGTYLTGYTFHLQDFLSLFNPVQYQVADGNPLYISLVGLGVVIVTVLLFRKYLRKDAVWRANGPFIIGASLIASVIMVGTWTFIPAVLHSIPLLSEVRQLARYAVIVQFCLALLLGICIEVLSESFPKLLKTRKHQLMVYAAGIIAIGFMGLNTIYLYLAQKRFSGIDLHFVYENFIIVLALAGCLLFKKHIRYVLLGTVVLSTLIAPLWFEPEIAPLASTYPPNYYKLTPAISYLEKYYGQDRVLIENNALPVNIGDVYNIQTVNGYGATLPENYFNYLNEPNAANQPGQHMNLLNVRFVVSNTKEPGDKSVFYDKVRKITIYQRPYYVPRAYFASQVNACTYHLSGCTPIKITSYSDSNITLSYSSSKPQILVLSEVMYPGWRAYVDGKTAQIVAYSPTRTKLFRSINVPAGNHVVKFSYLPFGPSI